MKLSELADSIVEINSTSNGKASFLLGNQKYVQFKDDFDMNQMVTAGDQAFQKAYQDETMKQFVDPENASEEQPLNANSQDVERALPEDETSMDVAIKILFLISKAQGLDSDNQPITDAFTLERYGTDKIQYNFTNGGQWPV